MMKTTLIVIFVLCVSITSSFSQVYDAKCAEFYIELHQALVDGKVAEDKLYDALKLIGQADFMENFSSSTAAPIRTLKFLI